MNGARNARHQMNSRRLLGIACLFLSATACQPGRGGNLIPAEGQVEGVPGPYCNGSIHLIGGGVVADVSGRWYTRLSANGVDLQVRYRNAGSRSVTLRGADFASYRSPDRGEPTEVADITGMDLSDDRTDNDDATKLFEVHEGNTAGEVTIAPGETRVLQVMTVMPEGVRSIGGDQTVVAIVPMPTGFARARFTIDSGLI